MSFFSPITRRSFSVRAALAAVYLLLAAGSLTMILPLLITVTGSVSGTYDMESTGLYPRIFVNDRVLWGRYLDSRYGGSVENFRMAWGDPTLDFYETPYGPGETAAGTSLWKEFLSSREAISPRDAGLTFTRSNKREAARQNRLFRNWLLAQYDGSLPKLNHDLLVEFTTATSILPPLQSRIVLPNTESKFSEKFDQYLATVPHSERLWWNIGSFYRAVYLPQYFGEDVARFNEAAGTNYPSFSAVPFPSKVPSTGGEAWFRFVQQILNPDFVRLNAEGEAARSTSGLSRVDFIRTLAQPSHLEVASIDIDFADWASQRGEAEARIPQRAMDWEDFDSHRGFWRWQFAVQNYVFVLDEVMVQGNGVRNTIILVALTVLGALTVNPMAAYALSRFRMRQSYQILLFFLATIAFPAEVAMIPNFLQLKELGLINTFGALVLPGLVNGFSIFLLKGFFDSLPRELYEAADIDGASEWQIFWGFTMNLSRPILAVIALNAFIGAYSAFFFAIILTPDQNMWTLMVWVYQLRQSAGPGIVYASLLITAVPVLVVYLCAQNVILRGIVIPTEK
jgi:multiple sugar transport system permease protein